MSRKFLIAVVVVLIFSLGRLLVSQEYESPDQVCHPVTPSAAESLELPVELSQSVVELLSVIEIDEAFTDDDERQIVGAPRPRRITWSVQRNGHMRNISNAETIRQMENGFKELEAVCNVDFVRLNAGGNLRYEFHPNSGMITYWNGIKQYALGLAYPNGRIKLNNERVINANKSGNRNVQAVTLHEAFHVLMRWNHSTNKDCLIGVGWSTYFCRREVEILQGKYGVPAKTWYPVDRALVGKQLKTLRSQYDVLMVARAKLIAQRDASTDKPYRTAKQKEVLANLELIKAVIAKMHVQYKRWFEINKYWKGVPKVHTAG